MIGDKDAHLDEGLENSFPASDPRAATNPSRFTGPEVAHEGHTGIAIDARIRQKAHELWLAEASLKDALKSIGARTSLVKGVELRPL